MKDEIFLNFENTKFINKKNFDFSREFYKITKLLILKALSLGMSPNGKATDFDSVICRFEPYHPNHF